MSTPGTFNHPEMDPGVVTADLAATKKDARSAMWWIAAACAVGSLYASGQTFYLLGGHWWSVFEGIAIALTVDFALFKWMRIAQRLRAYGAESRWGKTLEILVFGMTVWLNLSAGIAPFLTPGSPAAAALITTAHIFGPIIAGLVFVAIPKAELLLDQKEREARDAAEAMRQQAVAADLARADSIRREQDAVTKTANNRAAAEANERMREGEIKNDQHQREMTDRREARELETKKLVNTVAAALTVSASLRALAMAVAHSGGASPGGVNKGTASSRHQGSTPASPASSPGGSPAVRQGASPGVRQPSSPAVRQPKQQVTPDMARLVTLAKELLAREPEMGRPTLATALGVTEYKARTVLAEIKKERDAEFKAELDDVLAGRITQNADGESGGTTDGRS